MSSDENIVVAEKSLEDYTGEYVRIDEKEAMTENVDHPKHYNSNPSGVECIDVIEHMTFNVGSAMKYLWRCSFKGALIEDLKKARFYVNREIAKLEKESKT